MSPTETQLLALLNAVRRNKRWSVLAQVAPTDRLREELGFDSLDLAELTIRIEEQFGVDVFDERLLRHWGEVVARVERVEAKH